MNSTLSNGGCERWAIRSLEQTSVGITARVNGNGSGVEMVQRFRQAATTILSVKRIMQVFLSAVFLSIASLHAQNAKKTTTPVSTGQPPVSPASQSALPIQQDTKAAKPASSVLPLNVPQEFLDAQAQGRQVLTHVNGVIRYNRLLMSPIQKVGEPTDVLYREEAITKSRLIATYAFQAGLAEAKLLAAYEKLRPGQQTNGASSAGDEAEKLERAVSNVTTRIANLKIQEKVLSEQVQKATPSQLLALRPQMDQVQGSLQLNMAMSDALGKILTMSDANGHTGLTGDIEQLERTAPELTDVKAKIVPAPLQNLSEASSSGVSNQVQALIQLLGARHDLDRWSHENDVLHNQALALRTPIAKVLGDTLKQGQELSVEAENSKPPSPAATVDKKAQAPASVTTLAKTKLEFASMTGTFEVLSDMAVPLSQEIITLEQNRANLAAWRAAVNLEYRGVRRSLLLRMSVIILILCAVLTMGEIWRRLTIRYVHDVRRRRQFLGMRRLVIGFLSGLVLIFGFVSHFNSLATFAGFITAGLAVGLQTILLSVAAYFFIIGRYGVRVGDRITSAGVTGDVIEVGLVRFYVMELAGNGLELQTTGRVVVFSNAILFQAGTPLYKQMPGTEYAWQEMTTKLQDTANYRRAGELLLNSVTGVYENYKQRIQQQHESVQAGLDTAINEPLVESRLQFIDGGLQLLIRFPVEIRSASRVTQQVTDVVLELIERDECVKKAVTAFPVIRAAGVKA